MTSAAETPRVLDVRDFVQARETELRYLLQAVKQDVGERSFGAPFLPRHLRRRATSHRRFAVRRRPNLRLAALYGGCTAPAAADDAAVDGFKPHLARPLGATDADGGGSKRRRVSALPRPGPPLSPGVAPSPGSGVVATQSQPLATHSVAVELPVPVPLRPTNRRMRRRPARLQSAAEASCCSDLAPPPHPHPHLHLHPAGTLEAQHPEEDRPTLGSPAARGPAGDCRAAAAHPAATGGHPPPLTGGADAADGCGNLAAAAAVAGPDSAAAGGGLRQLETHVWHARRMAMERRWGHVLASGSPGRFRGSRSLLSQLRGGSLLHDSTYVGCVELRGQQRHLAQLLRRMSDPARLDELHSRAEVVSGAAEWSLLLHRPGAFPRHPLAPVRALWLTPDLDDLDNEQQQGGDRRGAAAPLPPSSRPPRVDADGWAGSCVLWLWVHAAAFREVWGALHRAAEEAEEAAAARTHAAAAAATAMGAAADTGGSTRGSPPGGRPPLVVIRSRCCDLRRIDLIGGAASAALARVLQPLPPHPPPAAAAASAHRPGGGGGGRGSAAAAADDDDSSLGGRLLCGVWQRGTTGEGGGGSGGSEGGAAARWRWPAGAVVGCVAADPRLAAPLRGGGLHADALAAAAELYGSSGGSGGDGPLRFLAA